MAGSGGTYTRLVTFSEVMLGQPSWHSEGRLDSEGFVTYTHRAQDDRSTVIITRSDGKVLSFDVVGGFSVHIRENVIRYIAAEGPASEPFQ
jgi:hypothetical protein